MHSTRARPKLQHELLAERLRQDLDYALTVDLTGMSWRDLAQFRGDLCASETLQLASGTIAPRETWKKARGRVEAQMLLISGNKPGYRMRRR